MENDGLLHRLLLDRLLGAGTFRITQSSGHGAERDMSYRCGCQATERALDRFEVIPCDGHRDTIRAESLSA
jgi:hypothetical protein